MRIKPRNTTYSISTYNVVLSGIIEDLSRAVGTSVTVIAAGDYDFLARVLYADAKDGAALLEVFYRNGATGLLYLAVGAPPKKVDYTNVHSSILHEIARNGLNWVRNPRRRDLDMEAHGVSHISVTEQAVLGMARAAARLALKRQGRKSPNLEKAIPPSKYKRVAIHKSTLAKQERERQATIQGLVKADSVAKEELLSLGASGNSVTAPDKWSEKVLLPTFTSAPAFPRVEVLTGDSAPEKEDAPLEVVAMGTYDKDGKEVQTFPPSVVVANPKGIAKVLVVDDEKKPTSAEQAILTEVLDQVTEAFRSMGLLPSADTANTSDHSIKVEVDMTKPQPLEHVEIKLGESPQGAITTTALPAVTLAEVKPATTTLDNLGGALHPTYDTPYQRRITSPDGLLSKPAIQEVTGELLDPAKGLEVSKDYPAWSDGSPIPQE